MGFFINIPSCMMFELAEHCLNPNVFYSGGGIVDLCMPDGYS